MSRNGAALMHNVATMRKSPGPQPKAKLRNVQIGSPMGLIPMDIWGPLPETSAGNSYVPVVCD